MPQKLVRIEIGDSYGISRGMLLSKKYFDSHVDKGISLVLPGTLAHHPYNEIVEDTGVQAEIGYSDAYFYPDLDTMQENQINSKILNVIGDLRMVANNPNSAISRISSRGILQNALKELETMGYKFYGAFEYEFYLFNKTDSNDYSIITDRKDLLINSRQSLYDDLFIDIMDALERSKIYPETFHFELGESQMEITCSPVFGVTIADNAMQYKRIVKEVCQHRGYYASFMTQPLPNLETSSAHLNHSLWDIRNQNLFFDSRNPNNLSDISRHWLGGLQEHFKALVCLAAPNINCYESLFNGFGTAYNTWGIDNRSTNFRFKNIDSKRTYCEVRFSGAGTNPYLTMAAIIYAGIDGIKRKIQPKQAMPIKNNAYDQVSTIPKIEKIPKSFEDAIVELNKDEYMCRALGSPFMKCFNVLRKDEIERFEKERRKGTHIEWLKNQYFPCF